jgi:hypothetical protein
MDSVLLYIVALMSGIAGTASRLVRRPWGARALLALAAVGAGAFVAGDLLYASVTVADRPPVLTPLVALALAGEGLGAGALVVAIVLRADARRTGRADRV